MGRRKTKRQRKEKEGKRRKGKKEGRWEHSLTLLQIRQLEGLIQNSLTGFNPQEKQHVQHVLNILNGNLLATTKSFGEALELRTAVC